VYLVAPIPFSRLFGFPGRRAVESIAPRRTFDDVILPPATRRALENALAQVTQHDLIFNGWGLGERHSNGLGLAFNFAGPPGTGKTICAEAIAQSLGRHLLVVRYAELESMWMGETSKNVAAIFHAAREQQAVLFFDEADAIAGRRSTSVDSGAQRESNTVVSVLLQELENYTGVVIFATNLAANLDPAFERRIRTHILFELPGETERVRIWQVQLHPSRTPLASDVDFNALAHRYEVSGGDIQNAVLKAALAAAAEPIPDSAKRIHQRHFEAAIEQVMANKRVMQQSIFADETVRMPEPDVIDPANMSQASLLLAYGLPGAALLIALIALGVAMFK
jgi:SpoVK/Ycf46/Vps4 family AAA+-type ATPase